ncbi:hypothetical protein pEaSNUABM11_00122 [Erwinia phage pEa_SNUABM_11]|nr:hypothetical protein pEaSNUABM11_00122 [Erwinia phage pEa_SNUABM_11]
MEKITVRKIVSWDGPDYAGKTFLRKRVQAALEAMGYTVKAYGNPRIDSPTGQEARRLMLQSAATEKVSAALIADFQATINDPENQDVDFLFMDHFLASTTVHQGDVGKAAVFRSGLLNVMAPPNVFVSLDVDYNTAMIRARKRREEEGKPWEDDVLTYKYVKDEASWDGLRNSFRFALQILTEGGERCNHIAMPPEYDVRDIAKLVYELTR